MIGDKKTTYLELSCLVLLLPVCLLDLTKLIRSNLVGGPQTTAAFHLGREREKSGAVFKVSPSVGEGEEQKLVFSNHKSWAWF